MTVSQRLGDIRRKCRPDKGGDVLHRGGGDAGHTPEMQNESLLGFLSDTFDLAQG